jgi:hypothetical protein
MYYEIMMIPPIFVWQNKLTSSNMDFHSPSRSHLHNHIVVYRGLRLDILVKRGLSSSQVKNIFLWLLFWPIHFVPRRRLYRAFGRVCVCVCMCLGHCLRLKIMGQIYELLQFGQRNCSFEIFLNKHLFLCHIKCLLFSLLLFFF